MKTDTDLNYNNILLYLKKTSMMNTEEQTENTLRKMNLDMSLSLMIKDGNETIGVFLASRLGKTGYIALTSVHPDFRGKGWGRRLMNQGLIKMKECGIQKVVLEVDPDNQTALELYLSTGFTIENELVHLVNPTLSFWNVPGASIQLKQIDTKDFLLYYNLFKKRSTVWPRRFSSLSRKNEASELYLLMNSGTLSGYILLERSYPELHIRDIQYQGNPDWISGFLTSLICGEKSVRLSSMVLKDPLLPVFLKTGFEIRCRQLVMHKPIC